MAEDEEPKIPEEWSGIPIQDYFDRGYRPTVRKSGKRKYIGLRKGSDFVSLGPYSEEKWKILVSMYPRKLKPEVPIDERIKQLKEEGLEKEEIVKTLYKEGYSTQDIMTRGYPLAALRKQRRNELTDDAVQASIRGVTRGEGYLQELKDMIRAQISRSRELAQICTNVGLGVLLASLRKSGLSIEEFRNIAMESGLLKEALQKAAETAFKALEYYESDKIEKLEAERDEARAYATLLESKLEKVMRSMDPKLRLEKMIYNLVLLSGATKIDYNVLMKLVEKWLSMEVLAS